MRYAFYTVDVFTDRQFGGNQLAVLPDARGLSAEQMQAIAREFNFAESTFVLPPDSPENDAHVRIFTPAREVPFAGHPNVGTAFVLASLGQSHGRPVGDVLRFEEEAGLVPVSVYRDADGAIASTEFTAPVGLSVGEEVPPTEVAAACGVTVQDIVCERHPPKTASVGLPFTLAELSSTAALTGARPDSGAFEKHFSSREGDAVFLYTWTDDNAVSARMFAPMHGVTEDPATGSASAAATAFLAQLVGPADGEFRLSITQGVDMGRPSLILGNASVVGGKVESVRVGGPSVPVMDGFLTI